MIEHLEIGRPRDQIRVRPLSLRVGDRDITEEDVQSTKVFGVGAEIDTVHTPLRVFVNSGNRCGSTTPVIWPILRVLTHSNALDMTTSDLIAMRSISPSANHRARLLTGAEQAT